MINFNQCIIKIVSTKNLGENDFSPIIWNYISGCENNTTQPLMATSPPKYKN